MISHQKQIATFWQQLQDTIDQLLSSRSEDRFDAEPLLKSYRDQLQKIDQNLTFHFQSDADTDESSIEMVFGCDGYPESIHSVLSLIGGAPKLSGIQFKAFNHRYDPIPRTINIGDEFCDIGDFWYRLSANPQGLQLEIYLEDAPKVLDMDPRVEAVMIYMDALIGEYELMTRVATLEWLELPASPEDYGLLPLVELRKQFDEQKGQVNPIGIKLH